MLTKAQEDILHVVRELGSVNFYIMDELLKKSGGSTQSKRRNAIRGLSKSGHILWGNGKGHMYLRRDCDVIPSRNVSDALYVVCDFADKEKINLKSIYNPKRPAIVGYEDKQTKKIIELILLSSVEKIEDLALKAEEKYKKMQIDKKNPNFRYVFIIKNKNHMEEFPANKVSYPYAFAYENYLNKDMISFKKWPDIEYYDENGRKYENINDL